MSIYFKNQLRGYNVVVATLQAFSEDICRNCIGLEGAKTKVVKGLKKLKIDLENSDLSEAEKKETLASIERFSDATEQIDVAEDCECQKTAGNCKIGPACLAFDGAWGLMKQITEPQSIVAKPESIAASKVVDVRQACCQDTLATPIKDAIKRMKAGEILEVIITPSLKDLFNTFIEQGKYSILEETGKGEEVHFKIRVK
jgi:TusA-related sulfurtransferase